ncbi:hypothetical protein LMG29739_06354 [Paraburkholderia solisilvae]|uniref:Uncharacterized protein n=1 Tax=Paraburkholderia solisilvae TaxID=624376 RepID=A0A6J5F6N1_9BURK|nr:hypothetical protein LMG29739_06354 [Paraburkholderia solisilvae]
MHLRVRVGHLDQRTDRRRRRIEQRDLVLRDHLPEAARIRIRRHAFEHDLRRAERERPVRDIAMAGDPADVRGAPEDIGRLPVEGPLHRLRGPQQVTAGAVLHALRLAGRARRVQDEQRMLGADPFRRALIAFALRDFVHPQVAIRIPRDLAAGAAIHDHALHRVAATHRERFIRDVLQRQRLAAAHLFVGGNQRDRADVDQALVQRLRREAAEHHRVRRADPRAGLHRDNAFDRHRHVDHDAVALPDAALPERVRKARHTLQHVLVRDARDGAVIGFEDHRDALAVARFDMAIEAVVRRVQFAVFEPFVERCVRFVEHLRKRLVPTERLAREAGPEPFVIALRFGDERPVRVHAGYRRRLHRFGGRREHAAFLKNGFNR